MPKQIAMHMLRETILPSSAQTRAVFHIKLNYKTYKSARIEGKTTHNKVEGHMLSKGQKLSEESRQCVTALGSNQNPWGKSCDRVKDL